VGNLIAIMIQWVLPRAWGLLLVLCYTSILVYGQNGCGGGIRTRRSITNLSPSQRVSLQKGFLA
jgi:hypothetical protein